MYEVVSDFYDAKNDNHLYKIGDKYPVGNNKPSKTRIEELAKGKNKYGRVFIKEIKEASVNPAGDEGNTKDKTPDPDNGEGNTEE